VKTIIMILLNKSYILVLMKYRIFVAILLPEKIKLRLVDIQKKFKSLNLRWTRAENLHLTLIFIGWIEEFQVVTIKEILREISQRFSPFDLQLTNLCLGPNLKSPRMLWLSGPSNKQLESIYQAIKKKLAMVDIPSDKHHPLKVHITLGRAKGRELKGRKIDESFNISLPVREIVLMESQLRTEGPKYKVLAKFKLKT